MIDLETSVRCGPKQEKAMEVNPAALVGELICKCGCPNDKQKEEERVRVQYRDRLKSVHQVW